MFKSFEDTKGQGKSFKTDNTMTNKNEKKDKHTLHYSWSNWSITLQQACVQKLLYGKQRLFH